MISSLRIFITKHIDELTDISELDDTQKELLANSALLTSGFEMSVYDKLIKIFDNIFSYLPPSWSALHEPCPDI